MKNKICSSEIEFDVYYKYYIFFNSYFCQSVDTKMVYILNNHMLMSILNNPVTEILSN